MAGERAGVRGAVVVEDRRTERFIRHLLDELGFEKRNFAFKTAPTGAGAAEAWVLAQYPAEVRELRSRGPQNLCLIAVRDGDAAGVARRKAELDAALQQAGLATRGAAERIATPVPTWSIETWLLALLGEPGVGEAKKRSAPNPLAWKLVYEHAHGRDERDAFRQAAAAWRRVAATSTLPSLADGAIEFGRIEP